LKNRALGRITLRQNYNKTGEMSERQAERLLETYENASKNGKQWTHDVLFHRGTEKYGKSIDTFNEAFRVKSIATVIEPLEYGDGTQKRKRTR
jgi:hypothetical protein